MGLEFHNCTDTMVERLYDRHSGPFLIKLKSGDQVVADIKWRQGRFNNYYFYSEYFDKEIPLDDAEEIAVLPED